jgi:hypothetical protein
MPAAGCPSSLQPRRTPQHCESAGCSVLHHMPCTVRLRLALCFSHTCVCVCTGSQGTQQRREPLVQPAAAGAQRTRLAAGGPAAGGDDAGGARRPVRIIDSFGNMFSLMDALYSPAWAVMQCYAVWCFELLQLHTRALHCIVSLAWRQPERQHYSSLSHDRAVAAAGNGSSSIRLSFAADLLTGSKVSALLATRRLMHAGIARSARGAPSRRPFATRAARHTPRCTPCCTPVQLLVLLY